MSRFRSMLARVSLVALAAAALSASAITQMASAGDLQTVRERAQSVADEVTLLERNLEDLHARRERLEDGIIESSSQIGALESTIAEVEDEVAAARDLYIARAIEAYKGGTTGMRLEMMLAAESVSELLAVAEMNSVAVSVDQRRLEELEDARAEVEGVQDDLDRHKREQMEVLAEVEAISAEMAVTLDDRRALLAELADEVEELEKQVRREEQLAPEPPPEPVVEPPSTVTPAATPTSDVPEGYVSTGVTFGGVASWYGPGFAGNLTANGEIYDPMGLTAANKELPFNTLLFVKYNGRGVVVRINDRGPYAGDRIIDLSQGAAETVGMSGIGWVDATIVVKK